MKKKIFGGLSTLLLSSVLLVGCGNESADTTSEAETADTEDVVVVEDEKIITMSVYVEGELVEGSDKELEIKADQNVMEIMEEHYDIETADGFMTSIEGYEQDDDAGQYWLYYINDEMPSVGAEDYVPEDADKITWELETLE